MDLPQENIVNYGNVCQEQRFWSKTCNTKQRKNPLGKSPTVDKDNEKFM